MDALMWTLLPVLVAAFVWVVIRGRGYALPRSLPRTIGGIQVEIQDPHVADDHVLEAVWSAPVLLSNRGRRARRAPLLSRDVIVTAGRRHYAGELVTEGYLYRDGQALHINPGDVAVAAVDVRLPAGELPRWITLQQIEPYRRRLHHRVRSTSTALPPAYDVDGPTSSVDEHGTSSY